MRQNTCDKGCEAMIRLLVLDVDGTMTDGVSTMTPPATN